MSLYGRLFAAIYDSSMAGVEDAGLRAHRRQLLSRAAGRVIEVGAGTGLNVDLYRDDLTDIVFVEPEEPMARRLRRRLAESARAGEVIGASAEELPCADGTFDTAVCTLVLCTVGDEQRALAEIHRVLKPGGKLLFLEHVRSSEPRRAKWQDRLHGLWLRIGNGCHCNRDTLAAIEAAGFTVEKLEHTTMPKAPAIVRPMIVGTAERT